MAIGEPTIVRGIPRGLEAVAIRLGELGVATVHESSDGRGLMASIVPRVPGSAVGGTAVTCLNFAGDNLMLHAAIEMCRPGDIVVAAVTPPADFGMFGDVLATSFQARGIAGLVIDSGVRDVAVLRQMGLPVWSHAVTAAGTVKARPGWVNSTVVCGGVSVSPGDVVVADDDGVVVVPRLAAEGVLAKAEARATKEEGSRARYSAGELSLDVGGLRSLLTGVRIVDEFEPDSAGGSS